MADLAKRKPKERTIDIKDPGTGEKVGLRITLMAMADPRMSLAKRQRQDAQNRLERNGRVPKAEDIEKLNTAYLFAAMTEWEWGKDESGEECTFDGGKPEFGKDNVLRVFEALPFVRSQVDTELADEAAFFEN